MNLRHALAIALVTARKSRNLTQEEFGIVSSRTYLSALERGLKSPTIDKLEDIASVMGVHPASLLLLASGIKAGKFESATIDRVLSETRELSWHLPSPPVDSKSIKAS